MVKKNVAKQILKIFKLFFLARDLTCVSIHVKIK